MRSRKKKLKEETKKRRSSKAELFREKTFFSRFYEPENMTNAKKYFLSLLEPFSVEMDVVRRQ